MRSTSWRRTTSAQRASQGGGASGPRRRSAQRDVVGALPGCRAGRGTRAAAARRRAAAGAPRAAPARAAARRAAGPPRGAASTRRGELGHRGRLEERRAAAARRRSAARSARRPGGWPAASGRRGAKKSSSDADPLDAEHLAPDRRPAAPRRACAAPRSSPPASGRLAGRRQGAAVDLAVGGERQRGEDDEGGRDHVAPGSARCQALRAARAGSDGLAGRGDARRRPGACRPGRPRARDHRRLAHRRVAAQRRLDLARLDAEAADLHLVVGAAEELERAVRPPAREVAGAVERALPASPPNGSGTKRSAVSSGPAEVAAREAVAADVELARHADRHRLRRRRRARRPGCWRSAGRSGPGRPTPLRRTHRVAGGEGGVLGRAVAVDQRQRRAAPRAPAARAPATSTSPPARSWRDRRAGLRQRSSTIWWKRPAVSQSVRHPVPRERLAQLARATAARRAARQPAAVEQRRPRSRGSRRRTRPARAAGRPRPARSRA